jgi:hypothetical protein
MFMVLGDNFIIFISKSFFILKINKYIFTEVFKKYFYLIINNNIIIIYYYYSH